MKREERGCAAIPPPAPPPCSPAWGSYEGVVTPVSRLWDIWHEGYILFEWCVERRL